MKYWMYTLNNPTEEHVPPNVWPDVEYAIWQHECGEEGTEHIQAYVCFKNKKRVAWLRENCYHVGHWEPRNGTHEQAKAYCSKEDTRLDGPWTTGDDSKIPTKKGERTDLKRVFDLLSSGSKEHDIMTYTYIYKYISPRSAREPWTLGSLRDPRSKVGGVIIKTSDLSFFGPPRKRFAFSQSIRVRMNRYQLA